MKMIIIKILVVLVAIISLAMVVALFSKSKYTLTREIIINKPKSEVFNYVTLMKNQKAYSKWLSFDPNTKIEYKGTQDGAPGFILAFESKDHRTGKGEWEIKQIVSDERMDFELRFLAPFAFVANGNLSVETINANQTKLKWVYNSGMDWPMNFMLLFLDMDKIVGNDIMASMVNIKNNLENQL